MRKTILSFLAVMLCAVLPSFSAIQYCLQPEGFETGVIPAGWTQENVNGTALWTVEGGADANLGLPKGARSGDYRAVLRGTSGQVEGFVTKLITPAMNLTQAYNPQLVFSHAQVARFGFFDTLRVYYRVNATAPWQSLVEYTSPVTNWKTETILLPGYQQGTAYQLAFEASDNAGLGVVLDDISVYPATQCQDATIQNISVASTSAVLSLVCNGSFNHFEVAITDELVIDMKNFNPDSALIHLTTDEYDVRIDSLDSYKTYYAYVRTDCDDNLSGHTNWVSAQFKTTRIVDLPYVEDFEMTEPISGSDGFGKPRGWNCGGMQGVKMPAVYKGSTTSLRHAYSVDSTAYLAFCGTFSTTASAIPGDSLLYAVTPEINGNLANCEVDFWGTVQNFFYNGNKQYAAELTVGVLTDPNDIGSMVTIEKVKLDNALQFKHFRVSLASYTGEGRYIALVSRTNLENAFFLDNFIVREVSTPTPCDVRATNVLPTGFTVSAQLHGADSWNLKVATAYTRYPENLTAEDCLVNQTGITAANYQVQLPENELAGQIVKIYVQAVKNGVASEWSFPLTLRVPTTGVVPISLTFNAGSYQTFSLKQLINEMHSPSSAGGIQQLFSPLKAINLYPSTNSNTPTFDAAYLLLNGIDNYIVLPYISDFTNLEVTFRLSAGSLSYENNSRVAVGVMTDPYDLSTFTELDRFDGPTGRFEKVRVLLSTYTGTGHYIALRALAPNTLNSTTGSRNCIDNLIVQPVSNCLDASGVNAISEARSVNISWNTNGMTGFLVKLYSDADRSELVSQTVKTTNASATTDSISFSELIPSRKYYFTIQTICGYDTLIAEDVYSFITKLGVPFKEEFEGLSITNPLPAGWDNSEGTASEDYRFQYYEANGNPGMCVRFNSYNAPAGQDNYLATPAITLDGADMVSLTFDYKNPAGGPCEVLYSLDGDTSRTVLLTNLGNEEEYVTKTVDLTPFLGHTIKIYFHATSNYGMSSAHVYLDNVGVKIIDPNCMGISKLSVGNVTETEADINWTVGGVQQVYLTIKDYYTNTTIFSGTVTTNPYHLSNLEQNTIYLVEGYQPCGEQVTLITAFKTACSPVTVEEFGLENFNDDIAFNCWQVGIGDTAGIGATNVDEPYISNNGSLGNVLYINKKQSTTKEFFGNNYYAILPSLVVDSINHYEVVFNASTTQGDTANLKKLKVGILTDPNDFATFELIEEVNLQYAKDSTYMKRYTVSFADYAGDYMGDFGKYVMFLVDADATHSNVAFIDNVYLQPAATCPQVNDLEMVARTSSSIDLAWTGNAASYDVMLTTALCNPDTVTNPAALQTGITATHTSFINLQAGTNYFAYIRANCSATESSVWSSHTQVLTDYGIPFLETFDEMEQFPQDDWKVFAATVPENDDFSTAAFQKSEYSSQMSIANCDSRMSNVSGKAARVECYSSSSNGFLQSPSIDLTSIPTGYGVNLSFRAGMVPSSIYETELGTFTDRIFRVYVSEDGGETFKADSKIEWNCIGTGDYDYAQIATSEAPMVNVDLSAYAGKNIALGFYVAATGYNDPGAYVHIDSIALVVYDNSCLPVSRIKANVVGNNVDLTWKVNTPNVGVIVEVSDDQYFTNIISHDSLVGDSIHYSGLSFYTNYYVRVKMACSNDWMTSQFRTTYGIPFTEDYENTSSMIPSTWKSYVGDLFAGNVVEDEYAWSVANFGAGATDSRHAYSTVNANIDWWGNLSLGSYAMVSPEVYLQSVEGNDLMLYYDMALTTSEYNATMPEVQRCKGHTFMVAIMAKGDTVWTPIQTWQDSALLEIPSEMAQQEVDLAQYVDKVVRFAFYAFCDSTASSNALCHVIDNVRLRHVNPNCETPVVYYGGSNQTTASVNWDVETGASYEAQISLTDAFGTVIETITTTNGEYTFENLTPASTYYVRLRKDCGNDGPSGWSEPLMVRTTCVAYAEYPWTEDFETREAGTFEDPCWSNEHLYGSGKKVFEVSQYNTSTNKTRKLVLPDQTYGTTTLLALPTMQFDAAKTYELTLSVFRSASYQGVREMEGVNIYLAENAIVDADALPIAFVPRDMNVEVPGMIPTEATEGWYTYSFLINNVSGEKRILFLGYNENSAPVYLDDLSVYEYTSDQTIKEVKLAGTSRKTARIQWTLVDNSICHDVELVASTTPLDSAGLETATKIQASDVLDYTFNGLTRETTYYLYVRTVCDGVYGRWMSVSGTTTGLEGNVQADLGNEDLTAYLVYTSWGNSYSQHIYTAEELSAAGYSAGPIQSVAFNYKEQASYYDKTHTVLIGSTDRTSFSSGAPEDFITGLQVVYGPTYHTFQHGWVTYEFTEPYIWDGMSNIVVALLSNGDGTHMGAYGWDAAGSDVPEARTVVRYKDNDIIDINNLGASGSNGYAYSVRPNARFTQTYALEACPAVENVSAKVVGRGTSEILVSWTASDGDYVADYDVIVSTEEITDFTSVTPQYTVDSLSLPITGLTEGTQYYIYVRVNCDANGHDDGVSPWVGTTITTYEHCMPVKDLEVTFKSANSVLATWSKYTDLQETDFRYILSEVELDEASLGQYTAMSITDTAHLFENLAYETTHYLYVRGACSDSYSDWAMVQFTTPAACQPVENIQLVRVTANAARITWSHAPFAFETMWEVGIVGDTASAYIVTDTVATFGGLNANTEYLAYVRAICSENTYSDDATFAFTTKAGMESECLVSVDGDPSLYDDDNTTPFNNWYGCSWNQMIYPASLLGQEGSITRLSFYCAVPAVNFTQESVTIYMANTSMSAAPDNTSWVPQSDLQQVYHMDYYAHPTVSGWSEIILDNEFEYTGGNLAVIVAVENGYNYNGSLHYAFDVADPGATLYRRGDGDATLGQYPGTANGNKASILPLAQFCFASSSCPKVKYLEVSKVTDESASASWYPGSSEASWYTILSEKPLSDAEITAADKVLVNHTAISLTDLQKGKDYFLYVAPNCNPEVGEWTYYHFITEATCFQPVAVRADNVGVTEADIYFTYGESGPAASYDVIYGPAATFSVFEPTTYQSVTVTDTTAHITGMQADTYYNVAVRAHCSDDDISRYSEPATFITECATVTSFPWSENFENYEFGDFYNHCWSNEHTATESFASIHKNKLYQVTNFTVKGETAKVLVLQDAAIGNKTQLTLPKMNFSADQPLEFSLRVYRTHAGTTRYNEGLHIYISNTDTIDETAQLIAFIPREYSINGTNVSAADTVRWCNYHFTLPAIGEGHIVIEGVSEYTLPTYFDDLEVAPFNPNCAGVSNLEITDIDVASATINWATVGNDTVRVTVTNESGVTILNRQTTAKSMPLSGLTSGAKYKVEVQQLCSERSLITSFTTFLTIPYTEDVTKHKGWQATVASNTQSYYWSTTDNSEYVVGEMSGRVFYFFLYYWTDLESRLMSPVIRVPELGNDEMLYLDWLMGAIPYAYGGGTSLDPSTAVSVDVCVVDTNGVETWTTEKLWEGMSLSEIAWETSGKYTLDLSKYAGKDIRLGFYAGINGASGTSSIMLDDIYLHRVKGINYDANACSWVDYQDDYFAIPIDSFILGTTEYRTVIPGIEENPDTVVTMNLTVSEATQTIIRDTICEGELYDRNDINPFIARTSVIKPHFYTSVNGCDSLVSLHIEVKPSSRRDTTILACKDEPVTVNGKTYYNNIVVIDTLKGVNACDSIARTFIEFSETTGYEINQHRILCAGETYTDVAFPNGISAAGTYTATVKTAYGCDSVVTVNMLVANNGAAYDTITIDELPYVYAEDTIMGANVGAGDYEFKLQASCGQVTLYIHVTDKAQAVDNLKVLQLSVAPNPASVGEPIEILSQVSMAPDFNLMVFDAIGQLVYATDEPSLTIPGLPVAGYYTVRLTSDGQSFQAKLLVK